MDPVNLHITVRSFLHQLLLVTPAAITHMRKRAWIPFERPHSALDVVKLGTEPMGVQHRSQSSQIIVSFQNGDRTDLPQSNPENKFASFATSVDGATMILDQSTAITAVPSAVIPNTGHPP